MRHQAAHGAAGNDRGAGARLRPITRIHRRFHRADEIRQIGFAFGGCELGIGPHAQLLHAGFTAMIESHGNHRQTMLFMQTVEHFVGAPFAGIAGRGVEDILSVHEVHHRIAAIGAIGIPRRQIDPHGAIHGQRRQCQTEGFEARQIGHRRGTRRRIRRLLAHEHKGNSRSDQHAGQQAGKDITQGG